ncbi:radical SAM protein [archaeon]|nr:MAG: radical SAM protein [archaeon]
MYAWASKTGFYYKVTYSPNLKRLHVYNYGCNFKCSWCYYKLRPPIPDKRIPADKIIVLIGKLHRQGKVKKVNFLGGEPTINPDLEKLVNHCKGLGLTVKVITNGSNEMPAQIDEASVSIKLFNDELHLMHTGKPLKPVLANIVKMYRNGVKLDISTVYIPGLNDEDIAKIAEFIASIDPKIHFHIIGYVEVPGAPWRKPTNHEVINVVEKARKYLVKVTWSNVTAEQIKYNSIRLL